MADFRGDSKFSTWLYTIVQSTSLSFLRKKKHEVHSLDVEHIFEIADQKRSEPPINSAEQRSKKEMLTSALNTLSPDDARLLTLFYQAEQSLEEIGRIMQVESNTVKVKLHRARKRLKEKMEIHFAEEVRDLTF